MPPPSTNIILSHIQVEPLLRAHQSGQTTAPVSLDLNLTTTQVQLGPEGITFPTGERLSWELLEEIADEQTKCFLVEDGSIQAIQQYSEATHWMRSLMPTRAAPTMLVSGIPMHRIKDTDPRQDTLQKIRALSPIVGRVLDTATGLGYTAIEAAKTASEVVTIELDPTGLEIARLNPWSRDLFTNPKIKQRIGDAYDIVQELEDHSFNAILHDPPTFSLAGDLYSGEFYGHLYRLLARNGRLFHYIGDLESSSGQRVSKGVIRRLQEVGFTKVIKKQEAFGVLAYK
jgi:predicted methyltransferase